MATTPAKVTVAALIEKTEEDKLEAPAAEEEEQVAAPVEAEKEVWDKEGEEGEEGEEGRERRPRGKIQRRGRMSRRSLRSGSLTRTTSWRSR